MEPVEKALASVKIRKIEPSDQLFKSYIDLVDRILRRPIGLLVSDNDVLLAKSALLRIVATTGENENEKMVGCLVLIARSEKEAQVKQVAVEEEFQGKGIGRMMFDFLEKEAKLIGFSSFYLDGRFRARSFYQKLGYTENQERGLYLLNAVPHMEFRKTLQ